MRRMPATSPTLHSGTCGFSSAISASVRCGAPLRHGSQLDCLSVVMDVPFFGSGVPRSFSLAGRSATGIVRGGCLAIERRVLEGRRVLQRFEVSEDYEVGDLAAHRRFKAFEQRVTAAHGPFAR